MTTCIALLETSGWLTVHFLFQVRSEVIATYALCGFANMGSIGIQLGGLTPMAPERKGDLASISIRALIAGTVACFMTACIAGEYWKSLWCMLLSSTNWLLNCFLTLGMLHHHSSEGSSVRKYLCAMSFSAPRWCPVHTFSISNTALVEALCHLHSSD